MSMISSQCDELRDWACELRNLANGPVNEGFPARANLFKSADAMCQAADTIWELRCKLAGVVDQRDEIERLKAENAKLRELCRDLFDRLMDKDEICGECRSSCEYDAWNFGIDGCIYKRRMDELGVEVDDGTE